MSLFSFLNFSLSAPQADPDHLEAGTHPEVWPLVLPYLRKPRPPPLSRPARSSLRQPDLCSAARVCRFFREICEEALYTEIITDTISDLALNILNTRISSHRRFRHTRRLYIEYWPTAADPPYHILCRPDGGQYWSLCGRTRDEIDGSVFFDCHRELGMIDGAFRELNRHGMAQLFPNLVSVSVGSIYGIENTRWREFRSEISEKDARTMETCGIGFNTFLMSGNLEHLCVRDNEGPLSVNPIYYPPETPQYTQNLHFSLLRERLHCPLDMPIHWTSDIPIDSDMALSSTAANRCAIPVALMRGKVDYADKCRAVDLTIFCSSTYFTVGGLKSIGGGKGFKQMGVDPSFQPDRRHNMPEERLELICRGLGEKMQESFREGGAVNDVVRWRPSHVGPVCGACQSGVPGKTEGVWSTGPFAVDEEKEVQEGGVYFDELD